MIFTFAQINDNSQSCKIRNNEKSNGIADGCVSV